MKAILPGIPGETVMIKSGSEDSNHILSLSGIQVEKGFRKHTGVTVELQIKG